MPCFRPLNVRAIDNPETGKKRLFFGQDKDTRDFYHLDKIPKDCGIAKAMQLPCGNCIGCRLERSRQWAVRCTHEASLYDSNCFVTLTFNPKAYAKDCPTGSLDRRHVQLFMKRLRKRFSDRKIRSFYCGEYGEKNGRAHYHLALFNVDFPDKEYWKSVNGHKYFRSQILESIWSDPETKESKGHCVIGDLTFESAAYVARYCLKKINGREAEDHYTRVNPQTGEIFKILPEFSQASLKPGIGSGWFEKFGMTDIFPRDECVINGVIGKPPRFYDKLLERVDPDLLKDVKRRRELKRIDRLDDIVYSRLKVKEKIQEIRLGKLVRILEAGA